MAILNFGFFANRERGRREKKLKIKNHDPNEEKVLDYQGSAQVRRTIATKTATSHKSQMLKAQNLKCFSAIRIL